jgi:hypothetical protein
MKKPDTKNRYRKIRAELAAMLGFDGDPDALAIDQSMRLDTVFALKLSLDEMRGRLYRGEAVDTGEMRQIATAIEQFLPARATPEHVDRHDDPHARLMRTIDAWIANREVEKAERIAAGLPADAKDARIAELESEVARLRGLPAPEGERVIDPPLSAITPPGEQTGGRNLRVGPVVGHDDHKVRPKPVIDAQAESVERMPDGTPCPPGGRWCSVRQRVVPIPPVAKSGAETKAQMARANDRSLDYKIMSEPSRVAGEPVPSLGNESWRGHTHRFE